MTKRALTFAILAYVTTFIFAIFAAIFTGFDPAVITPPTSYCVAIVAFSTLISAISSHYYFTYKSPKIKANAAEGFKFGILLVVLGLVLDLLLFMPLILSSGSSRLFVEFYSQVYVYYVFAGVLGASTAVGYLLRKKR